MIDTPANRVLGLIFIGLWVALAAGQIEVIAAEETVGQSLDQAATSSRFAQRS